MSRLPAELWEQIISHLNASHTDLRACSSVSPTFRFAAQALLFADLMLNTRVETGRFIAVARASPHLSTHVRRLALVVGRVHGEIPALVRGCAWPKLRELELHQVPLVVADAPFHALCGFLAMRTVRELTISFTPPSAASLRRFLGACSADLDNVTIWHCEQSESSDAIGDDFANLTHTIAPASRRPLIRTLNLIRSSAAASILLDPLSPLDLAELRELHLDRVDAPVWNVFLRETGHGIEKIYLDAHDALHHIDVSLLPSLCAIHFTNLSTNITGFIRGLKPPNGIRTVFILISDLDVSDGSLQKFGADFESAVVERLTAIERIVVDILFIQSEMEQVEVDAVLRSALPELSGKGKVYTSAGKVAG
ncbi:unnamed protein product [Mycena citricolor]|uniref:F-box domain-containing protein n=1 Tax=Mycena citricolor TaxID=2018698 RepID=A0AAD2K8N4_9AGAR|nr:unnamed protein product [Mycena citricolor]